MKTYPRFIHINKSIITLLDFNFSLKACLPLTFSLFLIVNCSLLTVAQQPKLDSLYSVWEDKLQPDSVRVKAYSDYIWGGFLYSNPDTAAILANALQAYAKKHNYAKASAIGYRLKGIANYLKSNYITALEYFEKSLKISEEIKDKHGIANSLYNMGNIYDKQGDLSKALVYLQKSLAIDKELGDKKSIAGSLNNIGNIFSYQGDYIHALDYLQKSFTIYEEIGDKKGISSCLINIGSIFYEQRDYKRALEYFEKCMVISEETGERKDIAGTINNVGNIYYSQSNYTCALEYYEKARAINEESGNKQWLAINLSNIGNIYFDQGHFALALEYYKKSLTIREEIGDKFGISANLNYIGFFYKVKEKFTLAVNYCQKGLALAKEIGALDLQSHACKCLYESYKAIGNSSKALEYYEQMITVRDSLYNEENTKKLVQIDMQYEFDRKEAAAKAEQDKKDALAQQEIKRQQWVRNGFMGGFVVVLLFAAVFLVQRNKIGKEKQRSDELLLNILPQEVAEELKERGSAEAKLFDNATVLFTDFKGFTVMSETLSPRELVNDLNHCFSAFDRICEKYGIEKIKTIGDAYMAAGGLPTPNATHAKDVVKAALEICDFIEKGKAEKMAAGLPYFEIRIGINTGPVVAGIVGVKKFQYDIWGDTVNTASRMESAGEVGKVNISFSTYELLKDDSNFIFENRGKIDAKGKGEMEMYFVSLNSE